MLAGIELGIDEEHLVVEGQLVHKGGQINGVVPGPIGLGEKFPILKIGLGHHFQGVGGADLGADAAALAGFRHGIEVQGEPAPGHPLGDTLEDLEIAPGLLLDGPVGDRGIKGRIRAGRGAQAAGDTFGRVIHRQRGADVTHVPIAAGGRGHNGQKAVPGHFFALQDGLHHAPVEEILIVVHQINRMNHSQIVFFREGHREPGGAGALAEILGQGRGINGIAGIQGQGSRCFFGDMAGGLLRPVLEEGDIGFQHLLLSGS